MINHHDSEHFPMIRRSPFHVARHIATGILFGGALLLLLGSAITLLWNALVPALFPAAAVAHITFWRGIGLLLLARILVGGFHRGGFGGHRGFGEHRFGEHRMGRRPAWRQYEDWWHEVGEQSYRDYAATRSPEQK